MCCKTNKYAKVICNGLNKWSIAFGKREERKRKEDKINV